MFRTLWDVKLTTNLHRVPKLKMVELYLHSNIRNYKLVLNKLSTGITLSTATSPELS
jgi:hypothetical protein